MIPALFSVGLSPGFLDPGIPWCADNSRKFFQEISTFKLSVLIE